MGKWYFIVLTYDIITSTIKFYLNSVLIDSKIQATNPVSDKYLIGVMSSDNANPLAGSYFDGFIANARIYEEILTIDKIKQLKTFYLKKYGLKPDFFENQ